MEKSQEQNSKRIVGSSDRNFVLSPDPTSLTNDLVEKARADMRRELDFVRQLLTQRIDDRDTAVELLQTWRETLPRRLEEAMECHKDVQREHFGIFEQRFLTVEERFRSFSLQFTNVDGKFLERDTRSDMMAQSGEKNIASALAAAKELVSAQNIANANAIDKNSRDTDKRIDTTVQLLQTSTKALDERISVLAEQAKVSMTRQEVEQLFRTLTDKLDGPTGLAMRLEGVIARGGGMKESWGVIAAVVGFMIGAVGIVVAIFKP